MTRCGSSPKMTSLFTVASHELAQQMLTDSVRFSSAGYAMTLGQVIGRTVDREPDDYWEEPSGPLAVMVQARSELAAGDLQLLYLTRLLTRPSGGLAWVR